MTKAVTAKGRPRKAKSDRAPTVNFTMRLRPSLLDELRKSAESNERSITAEAESRLSQPPVHEVGKMVGLVVDAVEQRTGKPFSEVRSECLGAIHALLPLLSGIALPSREQLRERIDHFERLYREYLNEGNSQNAKLIKEQVDFLRSQMDVTRAVVDPRAGAA